MWPRLPFQLAALLIVLVVPLTDALSQPSFPAPPPAGQFVSDTAGLVTGEDRARIDQIAGALEAERGYPIAVVTIRSLAAQGAGNYMIDRYAAELARSWPADGRMRTHGMLLVVAADDRGARIQLGSAWGTAHDERARRVMDRLILPAFRNGHLSTGIVDGVRGFDAMARQFALPAVGKPWWLPSALVPEGLDGPWWTLSALVAGALVVLVGLVSLARSGRRSWAWAAAAFIFALVLARFFGGSAEASDSGGGATGQW